MVTTRSLHHRLASPSGGSELPDSLSLSIAMLAPDILEEIFDICMSTPYRDDERRNQLAFSQVCRQWRLISLSFSRLWRTIDVTQPDLAKEFLIRSGTYPLRITSGANLTDIGLHGNDLKLYTSRITSFDISFQDHRAICTLFGNLGSDLTALTTMSLKHIHSPNRQWIHIDVPILTHVRKLELHGVAIPWTRACTGSLEILSLLGIGRLAPSISQLHTILQSSPQLQHLSLQYIEPSCLNLPPFGAGHAVSPCSLPCLDELIISSTSLAVYEILSIIVVPSTCRLQISSFSTDGFTSLLRAATLNITHSSDVTTFRLASHSIQLLRSSAEPWSKEPADTRTSFNTLTSLIHLFSVNQHSFLDCSRFTTLELEEGCLHWVDTSLLTNCLLEFINLETLRVAANTLKSLMEALSKTLQSSSQSAGHNQLVCPHLRKITFGRDDLLWWVIDEQGSACIVALAHTRQRASIPLSVLEFKQSRAPQDVIDLLKGLVAEVYVEVVIRR